MLMPSAVSPYSSHTKRSSQSTTLHCFKVNNLNGLDSIVLSKNEEYEQLVEFVRSKQAYRTLPEKTCSPPIKDYS